MAATMECKWISGNVESGIESENVLEETRSREHVPENQNKELRQMSRKLDFSVPSHAKTEFSLFTICSVYHRI